MRLLLSLLMAIALLTACSESTPPITTKDGITINYTWAGRDKDTSLIFLHGWNIDQTYWQAHIEHFAQRYQVVSLDLPGFGKTGGKRVKWSFEQYGNDVAGLVHQLQLKNVILVGHSMSGDVALEAITQAPDKFIGIIGVDNFKDFGMPILKEEIAGFFTALDQDYQKTLTFYCQEVLTNEHTPSDIRKKIIDDMTAVSPEISIPILRAFVHYTSQESKKIPQLRVPLLLLNSSATPTFEDSLKVHAPHSYQVFDVGPTGHYPMIEDVETFQTRLQEAIQVVGSKS